MRQLKDLINKWVTIKKEKLMKKQTNSQKLDILLKEALDDYDRQTILDAIRINREILQDEHSFPIALLIFTLVASVTAAGAAVITLGMGL